MRIPGDYSKVLGIYNKNKKVVKTDKTQNVKGKKDVVSLSNQAKDYQIAQKAVRQTPNIRQEKVQELEQKFASGTYDVSGKDVADKLVTKFMDEKA